MGLQKGAQDPEPTMEEPRPAEGPGAWWTFIYMGDFFKRGYETTLVLAPCTKGYETTYETSSFKRV